MAIDPIKPDPFDQTNPFSQDRVDLLNDLAHRVYRMDQLYERLVTLLATDFRGGGGGDDATGVWSGRITERGPGVNPWYSAYAIDDTSITVTEVLPHDRMLTDDDELVYYHKDSGDPCMLVRDRYDVIHLILWERVGSVECP